MQVTITVTGLDRVQERLTKLGASLHDFTAALETLGKQLILFYSNNVFISQGQAIGKTWKPLATSTQVYKSKHYPGTGPLVRTGALQKSFYSDVTPDTLFISNSAPYFPYQQQGTGANNQSQDTTSYLGGLARAYSIGGHGRGRNLPARPMLGVNATVESMVKAVLQADIKAKIAGTNL